MAGALSGPEAGDAAPGRPEAEQLFTRIQKCAAGSNLRFILLRKQDRKVIAGGRKNAVGRLPIHA